MPWCPKCKNEYVDGVTICSDCNTDLVDELPKDSGKAVVALFDTEIKANKFIEYLKYSDIEGSTVFLEKEQSYEVSVPEKDLKKAKKCYLTFYTVEQEIEKKAPFSQLNEEKIEAVETNDGFEKENADEQSAFDRLEDKKTEVEAAEKDCILESQQIEDTEFGTASAYIKKADQYKDLKSTAITFLVFSFLGIIFLILNITKILTWVSSPLQYIVMLAVFLFFFGVGINSTQRAKKANADAVLEEALTNQIHQFLNGSLTSDYLSQFRNNDVADEINFLQIMKQIKKMVTNQFGELDDSYLDTIIEEYYNDNIEAH